MRKYSKILLFAMIAVGMMASGAWAGTLKVNHIAAASGPVNVAYETLGANQTVSILGNVTALTGFQGTNGPAMTWTTGVGLTTGMLLNITLTGANFLPATYYACASNNAGNAQNVDYTSSLALGSLVVASATNSVTIPLSVANYVGVANIPTVGGNIIAISNVACGVSGGAGNLMNAIQISPTTAIGNLTATGLIYASGGSLVIDPAGSNAFATTMRQYAIGSVNSGSQTSVNSTIDYINGAANGSQFTGALNFANVGNAINVTVNAAGVPAFTAASASLTVTALLHLQDSASWAQVARVYLVPNAGGCTLSTNLVANTAPAGTVTLTVPQGTISTTTVTGSKTADLCIETTGNAAITTRTITGSQNLVITGTGNQGSTANAYTTINTWLVNAYQGLAPWLINASGAPGYCMINNNGTSSATISLNLKSTEAGTLPGTVALGSIAAGKSRTFQFGADSVTEVTTGVTGTAIPITGLTANARYSGLFTVTATPSAVQITCVQTYTTGSRTLVPVMNSNGGAYLTQ